MEVDIFISWQSYFHVKQSIVWGCFITCYAVILQYSISLSHERQTLNLCSYESGDAEST